jgi:NAD(P)-dependent dehydrogenase (short-subunit alcohol dehydrogenase family)
MQVNILDETVSDDRIAHQIAVNLTGTILYQRPEGLTGMRAGLAWRLRAKSMRYQRPVGQPRSQDFGPLVLLTRRLLPLLRTGRDPLIVMISSGYALLPATRAPTYSAPRLGCTPSQWRCVVNCRV